MNNNMRNEFEEYVKKLTTAICKDILLEKMEELYGKYESEYQKMETSTKSVVDASKDLQKETKKVDATIKEISGNTQNVLNRISADIEVMETNNKTMFAEVRKLNNENKEQFITALGNCIESYIDDLATTFEQENEKISEKLAGIVTPEDLQDFVDTIEENTRTSQELVSFIDSTYEREIEETIKMIIENTKKAQETMNGEIDLFVKKVLEDLESATVSTENKVSQQAQIYAELLNEKMVLFQKELSKLMDEEEQRREGYLQKQVELVKQIGPSDDKIQQLADEVTRLEQIVVKMWKVNTESQKRLQETLFKYINEQKEIERKKQDNVRLIEQKGESISWRIYMAFSNTIILCLFAIVIALLKPWEIWGIKYTVIIVTIFITVVFMTVFLGRFAANAIAKHQVKKYGKKFSK